MRYKLSKVHHKKKKNQIYKASYLFTYEIAKPAPKPQYGVMSVPPWGSMCMYSPTGISDVSIFPVDRRL